MRRRKNRDDEESKPVHTMRPKTAPVPVVSTEATAMRQKADDMFSQAEEVYKEAMTISQQIEIIRSRDNVVGTLVKPRKQS